MRWKGFLIFIVIIALITVISVFFMDRWIEAGLEKTGQAITGARVEIDHLDVNPAQLSIEWQRLQVADPNNTMQNIVETGHTAFRMHLPALLRKRVVIREMALENVSTGAPRETDGALPKKVKKKKRRKGLFDKAKTQLSAEIDNLPVMQFQPDQWKKKLNLDSLIVMSELTMPKQLDTVKNDILSVSRDWEAFYERFQPEKDLEKIKNDFKDLDPNSIKTIPELMTALKQVQEAQKTLKSIQDTVKTRHQQIDRDFHRIGRYAQEIDDWYQNDYQKVLEKAKLPDLSVRNIGMMLFGGTIIHRVERYLSIVETIRKYMPRKSEKPEKEKPQRGKGQNIVFPDRYFYPEFLIQKSVISGRTGSTEEQPGIQLSGEAAGVNSQPWIYGKPTTIQLKGVHQDQRALTLDARLDHTTETAKDHFDLKMLAVSLNQVNIAESKYLPSKIEKGRADIHLVADFENEDFNLKLDLVAYDPEFDFSKMSTDNRFIGIVRDVMKGMDRIWITTEISNRKNNTQLKMSSNLDDQVSRELKRLGSKALTEAQNKVKARLNKIRSEKMDEVHAVYKEKEKTIVGKIEYYEEKVEEQRLMIEAKIEQITEDIEARKDREENKLKKKAKGLLDDVLN